MDLRPELLPPPVSPERLAEVAREIERIEDLVGAGEPAKKAVAAFDERTGHDYLLSDFAWYGASRNLEEFAREAARPARPRVADITREELVEIVRRVEDDPAGEDTDYYLLLFDCNTPHPRASGLLFHPPAGLEDASAEQIVDAALAYRPIAL
ncbi:bacteriocin immunity protein [Actinacidiphila glaucinigra]|uniref:bacteriocin immunity protein n=1 Tax=Actinacidiphila glaucinigra TaxID=235986 RepID=UPI002DDC0CE8|nr:bacteriocin immunity protein [Actinacidiphila glaucinigra]WSD60878.1 bacteriocin immunity protein [Actinacidiphila glaucinigra]